MPPSPQQQPKSGWKTSEFAVVLLVVLPGVAALIEAIQKGDSFQAAILAAINAVVAGAYAFARSMAKSAALEAPADAKADKPAVPADEAITDPGVVPGPAKD